MFGISKLILFLFVLSVGKTPEALREFTKLQGEWTVVSVEAGGEKISAEAFPDKVFFLSSSEEKEQPVNSLAFSGQLDSEQRLKFSTISVMMEGLPENEKRSTKKRHKAPPAKTPSPVTESMPSLAIYQIDGDRMKLLVKPTTASNPEYPKEFVTTKDGREFLPRVATLIASR